MTMTQHCSWKKKTLHYFVVLSLINYVSIILCYFKPTALGGSAHSDVTLVWGLVEEITEPQWKGIRNCDGVARISRNKLFPKVANG